MQGVARSFFTLAIIFAICGMALGIQMAMTHNHSQMPVHAHAMVAGWLMSAVFAFFYHLTPRAAQSRLAVVHFWLTALSGAALIIGLHFLLAGNPAIEPFVGLSSMLFYASFLLFSLIAISTLWLPEKAKLYHDDPVIRNLAEK